MKQMHSILVVVDRRGGAPGAITKAVGLARQFGGRVELFLCEAELAYELSHTYDRQGIDQARCKCLAEGQQYLQQLRDSAGATDVEITLEAQCESPLYEVVARKALQSRPDLVIKTAGGRDSAGRGLPDANDWQLMRACPATLLLTRGRAWSAHPRIAAAVDVPGQETTGLPQDVMQVARLLALGCHSDFDVLHGAAQDQPAAESAELHKICEAHRVASQRVHVLRGAPESTLPDFAATQNYDVLVMGALTHRPHAVALVGTLTSTLLERLNCDFVLVKPSSYHCPVRLEGGASADRTAQAGASGPVA
jgi:universal stress protein E